MGFSTNGEINYGILFEEGFEFPWNDDLEGWWKSVNGYVPLFQIYDSAGNYLHDGVKPPEDRIKEYYDAELQWEKKHPLPVELVNYCSCECPMYLLALPGRGVLARRGYPEEFAPEDLRASADDDSVLFGFCEQFGIEHSGKAAWYLTSYWG